MSIQDIQARYDAIGEDAGGTPAMDIGDGWQAHEDRGELLAEIQAAAKALAALGIPDDGRPLAERFKTFRTTLLATADDLSRRGGRADERPDDYDPGEVYRHAAVMLRDVIGLIDSEHVPQLRGRVFLEEENARLKAAIVAERDKARAEGYDAGYKAGEEHGRECAEAEGRCSRGEHGWSDSMPGECPDCGVDVAPPDVTSPEPPPLATGSQPIWPFAIADAESLGCSRLIPDMQARDAFGRAKYGTPLTADNGRNHLADAYQEALDGVVYLRAAMEQGADVGLLYAEAMRVALRIRDVIDGREDPTDTAGRELGEMPDAEFAEHMERARKMLGKG